MSRAAVRPIRTTRPSRTDKVLFGEKLSSLLLVRGLSAAEAARRVRENLPDGASFTAANLSHYRHGRFLPRLPYLEALSLALGVQKEELIAIEVAEPSQSSSVTSPMLDGSPRFDTPPTAVQSRVVEPLFPTDRPSSCAENRLEMEDHGIEVRLKFDQRLSWDKALRILKVLKADSTETLSNRPPLHQKAGRD